ncbi:hypothetical protein BUE76_08610 [Cnuella takakiae]|nr:hypothetical protein BUE76_08610 [Cnuella takakiae]
MITFFTSCQRDDEDTQQANFTQAKTEMNVSYGSDTAQRFDVYLPANRSASTTPVVFLVHGGSWSQGHRSDFGFYIDSFKKRLPNYAIVNIGYRLVKSTATVFPVQEQDVKAAVEQVAANAGQYGISMDKAAIMGYSAGAHLAMLQAYKNTSPVRMKAVIDMFGPTDLTVMYNQPWNALVPMVLQGVTGTTPQANATLYQQSSPATFVTSQTTPTLILQGDADPIVDKSQSDLLEAKLRVAGVAMEYKVYPGKGHGWFDIPTMTDTFNRIEAFLKQHNP